MKQKEFKQKFLGVLAGTAFLFTAYIAEAEESTPIEMPAQGEITKKEAPEEVISGVMSKNPLSLRVTPAFGVMGAIDENPYLINKYSAGFSAEIPLSSNVSIEGVFRYATFNITKDVLLQSRVIRNYNFDTMSAFSPLGSLSDPIGADHVGEMRQIAVGGNIKYELFPDSIMTPFIGGGISYFNNEYTTNRIVKITLPQSVYGACAIGGMKLKLSREVALIGRTEVGSLLNNKNGRIIWGPNGAGASVYDNRNFRSYDKYWVAMAGISFGM
ncbi:MAG: hypothetical protein HYY61_06900 [Deltaproteobacteria bacterium]|nr:hypothetical protein [Deltaproteobacteria bacterium]